MTEVLSTLIPDFVTEWASEVCPRLFATVRTQVPQHGPDMSSWCLPFHLLQDLLKDAPQNVITYSSQSPRHMIMALERALYYFHATIVNHDATSANHGRLDYPMRRIVVPADTFPHLSQVSDVADMAQGQWANVSGVVCWASAVEYLPDQCVSMCRICGSLQLDVVRSINHKPNASFGSCQNVACRARCLEVAPDTSRICLTQRFVLRETSGVGKVVEVIMHHHHDHSMVAAAPTVGELVSIFGVVESAGRSDDKRVLSYMSHTPIMAKATVSSPHSSAFAQQVLGLASSPSFFRQCVQSLLPDYPGKELAKALVLLAAVHPIHILFTTSSASSVNSPFLKSLSHALPRWSTYGEYAGSTRWERHVEPYALSDGFAAGLLGEANHGMLCVAQLDTNAACFGHLATAMELGEIATPNGGTIKCRASVIGTTFVPGDVLDPKLVPIVPLFHHVLPLNERHHDGLDDDHSALGSDDSFSNYMMMGSHYCSRSSSASSGINTPRLFGTPSLSSSSGAPCGLFDAAFIKDLVAHIRQHAKQPKLSFLSKERIFTFLHGAPSSALLSSTSVLGESLRNPRVRYLRLRALCDAIAKLHLSESVEIAHTEVAIQVFEAAEQRLVSADTDIKRRAGPSAGSSKAKSSKKSTKAAATQLLNLLSSLKASRGCALFRREEVCGMLNKCHDRPEEVVQKLLDEGCLIKAEGGLLKLVFSPC